MKKRKWIQLLTFCLWFLDSSLSLSLSWFLSNWKNALDSSCSGTWLTWERKSVSNSFQSISFSPLPLSLSFFLSFSNSLFSFKMTQSSSTVMIIAVYVLFSLVLPSPFFFSPRMISKLKKCVSQEMERKKGLFLSENEWIVRHLLDSRASFSTENYFISWNFFFLDPILSFHSSLVHDRNQTTFRLKSKTSFQTYQFFFPLSFDSFFFDCLDLFQSI